MPTMAMVFDILARDRASQTLQRVGGGMSDLARHAEQTNVGFGKLGTAIRNLAIGGAIVKFGKDSVKAFADASAQQAKLAFAFQKFPKLADTNQAALQNLNSELQRKTKFDDDALASGQAVLAQFNLTGRQITQVTPLLADYAAKTGQDIPDAAKNVGRALLGNTRALKAIGISYKSTGDAGKDFTNITELMRQKIGGFAEAEGKTASGRLAILKNQFGELEEAAGKRLIPALTGLVTGLTGMVEWVDANERTIGPLVVTVGGLAAGMFIAKKAVDAWRLSSELMGGLSTKAVGGLRALKLAFTGVELTAEGAGRAMRVANLSIPVVGVALFAVTEIMSHFASKGDDATQSTSDLAAAMGTVKGSVTQATAALNENVRASTVAALQSKGAYDQAKLLGLSYGTVTDAALGNSTAIGEVNKATAAAAALNPQLSKSNSDLNNAATALSGTLVGQATTSKEVTAAERQRRGAMVSSSGATDRLSALTAELNSKEKVLAGALQTVINKFTILHKGALDQATADMAWEASIDAVSQSVKDNGHSLDIHTEKGRNNRQALIGMMTALNDKTTADVKNAGATRKGESATDTYARVLRVATTDTKRGEDAIRKQAAANHLNKDQVDALIRSYLRTPKQVATEVKANGVGKAVGDIGRVKAAIKNIKDRNVQVKFSTNLGSFFVTQSPSGRVVRVKDPGLAGGGPVQNLSGYGRKGVDTEHVVAAYGEHVWTDKEVDAVGGHSAMYRMRNAALAGAFRGFQRGGAVERKLNIDTHGLPAAMTSIPDTLNRLANGFANQAGKIFGKALLHSVGGGPGGPVGAADVSNRAGLTTFRGGRFSNLFAAGLRTAEKASGHTFVVFQGGFRPSTSYSGSTHNEDAIDARVDYALLRAFRRYVGAMGDRTGLGNWMPHMHGVPAPGHGYGSPSARAQYQDYLRRGGGSQSPRSPWGLKRGGVVYDPGLYMLAEKGPERVLTTRQDALFERLIAALEQRGTSGGGPLIHVERVDRTVDLDLVARQAEFRQRRGAFT